MGLRQYTDTRFIHILIRCRLSSVRERYTFMQTLRSLERSLDELHLSIQWLEDRMQIRLKAAHVASSALTDLGNLEEDIASSRRQLTYHIEGLIEGVRTRSEYYNTNQAENLSRLTILATCLLPLSISATVLSMQTRFADLGLLLYDLIGVTFLLGFITLTMFLMSKKVLAVLPPLQFGRIGPQSCRLMLINLWMLLMAVSCWFGMFNGVSAGLQVGGYESAGVFGILVLLTLLRFLTG
jgi:hypothetical protein